MHPGRKSRQNMKSRKRSISVSGRPTAMSASEAQQEIEQLMRRRAEEMRAIADLKESISQLSQEAAMTASINPEFEENNGEWRTKYETQIHLNEKLQERLSQLREKLGEERSKLKSLMRGGTLQEFEGAEGKKLIIKLTREKHSLQSQIKDLEWRLDQEGRNFQKVDEKRTAMQLDVNRKRQTSRTTKTITSAKRRVNKKTKLLPQIVETLPQIDTKKYFDESTNQSQANDQLIESETAQNSLKFPKI